MYFDRNIDLSEKIKIAKKSEGNYSSTALNEEIFFSVMVEVGHQKIMFAQPCILNH